MALFLAPEQDELEPIPCCKFQMDTPLQFHFLHEAIALSDLQDGKTAVA
jgi:hypothetical protein